MRPQGSPPGDAGPWMRLTDGLHHLEEAHNWRAPLGQRWREEDGTTRLGVCGGGVPRMHADHKPENRK